MIELDDLTRSQIFAKFVHFNELFDDVSILSVLEIIPNRITCEKDSIFSCKVVIDNTEFVPLFQLFRVSEKYDLFYEIMGEFECYLGIVAEMSFKEVEYDIMSEHTLNKLEMLINTGAGNKLIKPITKLYHDLGIRSIQESKGFI